MTLSNKDDINSLLAEISNASDEKQKALMESLLSLSNKEDIKELQHTLDKTSQENLGKLFEVLMTLSNKEDIKSLLAEISNASDEKQSTLMETLLNLSNKEDIIELQNTLDKTSNKNLSKLLMYLATLSDKNDLTDLNKELRAYIQHSLIEVIENNSTHHKSIKSILNLIEKDPSAKILEEWISIAQNNFKDIIQLGNRIRNTSDSLVLNIENLHKETVNRFKENNVKLLEHRDKSIHSITHQTKIQGNSIYSQIDALIGIYNFLKPSFPFPIMREWPASPDFMKRLINIIIEEKPETILDVGSGITSIIAGYCVQKYGMGKVISIDHERKYYNITKDNLEKHNLHQFVHLQLAPLKNYIIKGKEWQWYDKSFMKKGQKFDLIIIDGPPGFIQPHSRYPVLQIIKHNLNKEFTILLDDGARKEESEIVELWKKDMPELKHTYFEEDEKGTFLISNKK